MKTDKANRPFMPQRDGAGSFLLDNPDDGTPIKEMLSLGDRMLLITDKCTYEVQLADQIDPKRTNPDLPHNVQRKLFDYGINSKPLSQIFLQAQILFRKGMLPVDLDLAVKLSLDAMKEFEAMDRAAKEFSELEKSAIEKFEGAKQQARSFALPAVTGVDTVCKSYMQKAHHFGRAALSISRLFFSDATNWDKLKDVVDARYGQQDQFSSLLAEIVPRLKLVLNLRDALEHQNKGAVVKNFTLEPDGTVVPPTIELQFRKSVLPRTSVSWLLNGLTSALPSYFEMLNVHLAAKFAQPVAGLPIFVDLLSDDYQKAKHVRFGYWARMRDGTVAPFG